MSSTTGNAKSRCATRTVAALDLSGEAHVQPLGCTLAAGPGSRALPFAHGAELSAERSGFCAGGRRRAFAHDCSLHGPGGQRGRPADVLLRVCAPATGGKGFGSRRLPGYFQSPLSLAVL